MTTKITMILQETAASPIYSSTAEPGEKPTLDIYQTLQEAYDYLNDKLFDGQLPDCMMVFQRKARAMGYYSPRRWTTREGDQMLDEIAINPDYLVQFDDQEAAQTLAHEMCHLWQQHFGKPSRAGYHNKQWAAKMLEIGLTPSSTGKPGGKMTGQSVADYATPNGRFLDVYAHMKAEIGFQFKWVGATRLIRAEGTNGNQGQAGGNEGAAPPKPNSKQKFTCPQCGQNAWAKPTASLVCGSCMIPMPANEKNG